MSAPFFMFFQDLSIQFLFPVFSIIKIFVLCSSYQPCPIRAYAIEGLAEFQ
jgi:hypothetical protein